MRRYSFVLAWLVVAPVWADSSRTVTLQPPGREEFCRMEPGGVSVLPSGRYVTPAGVVVRITADPFGMALSRDGSRVVAVHDQVLTVLEVAQPGSAVRYPSYDGKLATPFKNGAFMGVQVTRDSRLAYLSGGNDGSIVVFDLVAGKRLDAITLNGVFDGRAYEDSLTGDMVLSDDGRRLFVLDQFNFRLVVVDLEERRVIASVKVGRFPFGLGVSPDESMAYVANVGIFDYPLVPGVTDRNVEQVGLAFPPYGVPSKEAEEGKEIDGKRIPGLGSPRVAEAVSVWSVDLKTSQVVAKIKTGYQMGERVQGLEIMGGSSPNSIAAGRRFIYVTNATNDNISVIEAGSQRIAAHIKLDVDPKIDRYRGLIPFGLALSPDEARLYVALSGLNAVGVIDTGSRKVLGYIPTGWFPTKLAVFPDGKRLCVVTARGHGAGPNGGKGFKAPVQGTYVGDIMLGTCEFIAVPGAEQLAKYTRQVVGNTFEEVPVVDNGRNPLPAAPGLRKSPIRHIVYITKENRTYDEVFGQVKGGNGDPTLARYGAEVSFSSRDTRWPKRTVELATVMPNHLKIAREFAMSDNFYCDSDASVHGHRWMVGTYPNEWVEANAATRKDERIFSSAPGRRYVAGSAGAVYPEDYNEVGGLWEQLDRHGVDFYNFGEGFEFSGTEEGPEHQFTGIRMKVVFPMPKALFDRTSRIYATYNTSVPDQFRIEMFEQELGEKWLSKKAPFPQMITMIVPNDHSAGERPDAGYPFKESYMADNDLAVGRVLHVLSRTPWWKDMLVIITEDDAQDGRDHVDAHRSLLMMVGPYVKRGYISHTHANFGAILKTVYHILDLPPVNQFDAAASLPQDFFTDQPDFRPYDVEKVDPRVFDPSLALKRYDRTFDWRKLEGGPLLDDDDDFRESHKEQGREGSEK
ncbi:MAG TPA: phosphoesterase [Phycisphaerae bacterium]|nr:phosphoesterase [Phycisphaerae bacterium]HRY69414.1 phosphoesterase [Phycisphaerae bacterium]HSA26281.1 phosphoesterase [Phycisphaerae bacterium]